MTIRRRILIAHISLYFLPLLLLLCTIVVTFAGVFTLSKLPPDIRIENATQFERVTGWVKEGAFFDIEDETGIETGRSPILALISPRQNYVEVKRDGKRIYCYGNEDLRHTIELTRTARGGDEREYLLYLDSAYLSGEKRDVDGHLYSVSHVCLKKGNPEDMGFNTFIFLMVGLNFCAFLFFVYMVSMLAARFIVKSILRPLQILEYGAQEISSGNRSVRLTYEADDEFHSVIEAFNHMAKDLEKSVKERDQQEEQRRELVASFSHDIRTPLTVIKAYVEGLQDNMAKTPEKQAYYLEQIRGKTEVLDRMVHQLFFLSKMDVGERALPLSPVDCASEIKSFLVSNRPYLEKAGVVVTADLEKTSLIMGNVEMLERIIYNLLQNSIKYKTEELVHVHISLTEENDKVRLTVTDDGPGVDETEIPHLLEPFFRTDKSRHHTEEGCGLGLRIVAKAALAMNGMAGAFGVKPHGLGIYIEVDAIEGRD